jgi:small subunit ribosomal protein S4e
MHIVRKTIPNFWPIARTGTKYMAVASHNINDAIPIIIIMRDILKYVKTMKEMKRIIHEKKVLVNGRIATETNYPVTLFDTLAIPSIKKFYRAMLIGKKMSFVEIKESEINTRICKIINKRVLPGKKIQINFDNGRNIISNEKVKTGDFAILDLVNNKIKKIIALEKGAEIMIVKGKHIGKIGNVKEIVKQGDEVIAKIKSDMGEISTNVTNLFAIE